MARPAAVMVVGISRPIVYEHCGDLPNLLEALVRREMEQVSATRLRDLTEGDPTELMLESLNLFLGAVEGHPDTWRLVLMPSAGELRACDAASSSGAPASSKGLPTRSARDSNPVAPIPLTPS